MEGQSIEAGHNRGGGIGNGALFGGLLITDPAELPANVGHGLKGVEGMSRQETGGTGAAHSPVAVDEPLSLTVKARQEISGGLPGAHDASGRGGAHNTDMDNLILLERGANREVGDPRTRLDPRGLHAVDNGAGSV